MYNYAIRVTVLHKSKSLHHVELSGSIYICCVLAGVSLGECMDHIRSKGNSSEGSNKVKSNCVIFI